MNKIERETERVCVSVRERKIDPEKKFLYEIIEIHFTLNRQRENFN